MVTKNLFQTMNKISMNPIMNAPMSKGRVYEQSLEKYFELTEQEDLAKLVANIRHAEDHDERRNLKANLPFRCPHYFRFKDNRRSQASIILPSRWKVPSLARTFLIMKRAHGKTSYSTWSIRHPANSTSTSASRWV